MTCWKVRMDEILGSEGHYMGKKWTGANLKEWLRFGWGEMEFYFRELFRANGVEKIKAI